MVLFKEILKWAGMVLGGAFVILVIVRAFYFYNLDKTNEQVEIIHNTKLQLSDVMGENLPPDPGELADKTVAGVDANYNGIRDDVELAIFAKYPNSAKTRAVLLQYALVLQMQMTLPIVNERTVTASVEDSESRANVCMWYFTDTEQKEKYVEGLQINTKERNKYMDTFYKKLRSFSSSNEGCDIDLSTL